MTGTPMRDRMVEMVHRVQDRICEELTRVDGQTFHEDRWTRPQGGGGRSRVLQGGSVLEKGGVNVSVVEGELSKEAVMSMGGGQAVSPEIRSFFATGISLVLHPRNPFAPTVHANYRYFERGDPAVAWWFGGGADLSPSYLFPEDASHFHQAHKDVCDRFDPAFYPQFKAWCDRYFFIPHRKEGRGVGGIFFDDLNDRDPEAIFDFVSSCADGFLDAYLPILERRKDTPYTDEHRLWQQIRRGRYVEFNLVYDRGTRFGLQTDGRIESILMSLPLHAEWHYCHEPQPNSAEAELVEVLQTPRDWAGTY